MIGSKLKPKDAYGSALEPLKGTFRCESLFPKLSTVSTRMATPTRLSAAQRVAGRTRTVYTPLFS